MPNLKARIKIVVSCSRRILDDDVAMRRRNAITCVFFFHFETQVICNSANICTNFCPHGLALRIVAALKATPLLRLRSTVDLDPCRSFSMNPQWRARTLGKLAFSFAHRETVLAFTRAICRHDSSVHALRVFARVIGASCVTPVCVYIHSSRLLQQMSCLAITARHENALGRRSTFLLRRFSANDTIPRVLDDR